MTAASAVSRREASGESAPLSADLREKYIIMQTIKVTLMLAVLAFVAFGAWQIGAAEVANLNFQEDIRNLAAQAGTHVGFVAPRSEEQETQAVIQKAGDHGIQLAPEQVTVQSAHNGEQSTWYLKADYSVPIDLGITSFRLHFTPASDRNGI